jgi:hypothetical protein
MEDRSPPLRPFCGFMKQVRVFVQDREHRVSENTTYSAAFMKLCEINMKLSLICDHRLQVFRLFTSIDPLAARVRKAMREFELKYEAEGRFEEQD